MAEDVSPGAPAAKSDLHAATPDGRQTVGAAEPITAITGDARKLLGLIGAVLAPTTLVTALAYYFGWRRERAFASYFGIDPTVLGFSTSDYVLRSVDALFVPVAAILLLVFAALCLHVLLARRLERLNVAPVLAVLGLGALAVGIALAAGHAISSRYIYLQALGPGVGVVVIAYVLVRWRASAAPRTGPAVAGLRYLAVAVVLVSLFWATSEYADSRGHSQAQRLARHLDVNPTATIFSKDGLNIDPLALGSGAVGSCAVITASKSPAATYRYRYHGFTLLVRSGGKYFLTPTPPNGVWNAETDSIFILLDNENIRIELTRGPVYPAKALEGTVSPQRPAFTC